MSKELVLNKKVFLSGLYGKLLIRLSELDVKYGKGGEKSIPWAITNQSICRVTMMKKHECRELMFFLKDVGLIQISARGIKLLFKIK